MQATKPPLLIRPVRAPFFNRAFLLILALLALALASIFGYRAVVSAPRPLQYISAAELQEKYGLQVSLLAVTAGGGMIDLRLKVVDGSRAAALLSDKTHFPALVVAGRTLTLPQETISQPLNLTTGANIALLFPNQQGLVRSGAPVSLVFGDVALEPHLAR